MAISNLACIHDKAASQPILDVREQHCRVERLGSWCRFFCEPGIFLSRAESIADLSVLYVLRGNRARTNTLYRCAAGARLST
jgi:hypothetical protein